MRRSADILACAAAPFLAAAALCGCGRGPASVVRDEWIVMDTVAAVQTRSAEGREAARAALPSVRAAVEPVFAEIESLLSRFDPSSELSRLAPLDDAEVLRLASPRTRPCYEAAFAFARETGGAFDPRWRGKGTLDLGAIAKGYALDLACEALRSAPVPPGVDVLVDLGGGLKAFRGGWNVGISGGGTMRLEEGAAVATSGRYFRGDHVKDARTGESPACDAYSVSVVHPSSAMEADALSTILFILGGEKGGAYLSSHRPEASAVWID